jgi:hypothetical protein
MTQVESVHTIVQPPLQPSMRHELFESQVALHCPFGQSWMLQRPSSEQFWWHPMMHSAMVHELPAPAQSWLHPPPVHRSSLQVESLQRCKHPPLQMDIEHREPSAQFCVHPPPLSSPL